MEPYQLLLILQFLTYICGNTEDNRSFAKGWYLFSTALAVWAAVAIVVALVNAA